MCPSEVWLQIKAESSDCYCCICGSALQHTTLDHFETLKCGHQDTTTTIIITMAITHIHCMEHTLRLHQSMSHPNLTAHLWSPRVEGMERFMVLDMDMATMNTGTMTTTTMATMDIMATMASCQKYSTTSCTTDSD